MQHSEFRDDINISGVRAGVSPSPMSDHAVFLRNVKAGAQTLEAKGVIRTAAQGGLEGQAVIKLAQRLKPQELLNVDQAIIELESAVSIALDVIARGERGTNLDAFISAVIARVAEETKRGDFESGARAVDEALAELDRREAEQREKPCRRSRIALLEQGVSMDTLRRDAVAVAARIEAIVAIDHPNQRPAELPAFLDQCDRFYEEGEAKGINFSVSVAIELARRMVATAHDAEERGTGENLLGLALCTLGGRESGTGKLNAAVAAYREALKERRRERVPLDWAMTQNNLGAALQALGEREGGTARLEEAVASYRAALEEFTRERVPLQWEITQNNLVNALLSLGERESGTGKREEAGRGLSRGAHHKTGAPRGVVGYDRADDRSRPEIAAVEDAAAGCPSRIGAGSGCQVSFRLPSCTG
jgi:tetratricopeptide (TPR) repeat protein